MQFSAALQAVSQSPFNADFTFSDQNRRQAVLKIYSDIGIVLKAIAQSAPIPKILASTSGPCRSLRGPLAHLRGFPARRAASGAALRRRP